nr:FtsQ-type POTRA domain-containing protein [Galbitalea soli]
MLAVLAVAIFSPLLALRTVTVEGAKKLSAAEVSDAVRAQLGTPLALIDPAAVRRELSQFTLIRSYVTEIVPPSTMVIHIVEREPIATLADGDRFDQVDAAGVVLSTTDTRAGLPLIDVGDKGTGSPAFAAAVQVILSMPTSISSRVRTVSATTPDDVRLTLTGASQTVVWGNADESDLKARGLLIMLRRLTQCRAQPVIDVSSPSNLVCGPDPVLRRDGATATATPTPGPTSTLPTP